MNFKQNIAKYITGNLTISQLPQLAIVGINEGIESESLFILAGLSENDNLHEINDYFEKVVEELKLELPNKRQAALIYMNGVVEEIFGDKKKVIEGIDEINSNVINCYDFYSETKEYCYDSIGFELIYGLFIEHEDLIDNEHKWNKKETLKRTSEIKEELLVELQKWKYKFKTVYNNGS